MGEDLKGSQIPVSENTQPGDVLMGIRNAAGGKTNFNLSVSALLAATNGAFMGLAEADTNPGEPTTARYYQGKADTTYAYFRNESNNSITIPAKVGSQYVVDIRLIWQNGHWGATWGLMDEPPVKINIWSAKAYAFGDQVKYAGTIWEANAVTLAADVPGVSTKWIDINSGKAEKKPFDKLIDDASYAEPFSATIVGGLTPEGGETTTSSVRRTDFVEVVPGAMYRLKNLTVPSNGVVMAFYDENNVSISTYANKASTLIADTGAIIAPENTRFYRIARATATVPTLEIVSNKNEIAKIKAYSQSVLSKQVDDGSYSVPLASTVTGGITAAGADQSAGGIRRTGYIPIEPGAMHRMKNVTVPSSRVIYAVYDENNVAVYVHLAPLASGQLLEDSGLMIPPANGKYYRYSYSASTTPVFMLVGNRQSILNNQSSINIANARIKYLEDSTIESETKNKYNRLDPGVRTERQIGIDGLLFNAATNKAITHFIPILPGEEIEFTGYDSSGGGYSGLYDMFQNPIPGTFVQSGKVTGTSGSWYARFSGTSAILLEQYKHYASSSLNPITAFVPFAPKVPKSYIPDDIGSNVSTIRMVGDSIAAQYGNRLVENYQGVEGMTIYNDAVGGEQSTDVIGRLGAIPFSVQPFTIPAGLTATPVQLSSSFGYQNTFDPTTAEVTSGRGYPVNMYGNMDCIIAGVPGRLSSVERGETYTFTRKTSGSALTLTRHEMVKPDGIDRNTVYISFMGTNGGFNPPGVTYGTVDGADALIAQHRAIADWIKPTTNDFLFLGLYGTGSINNLPADQRAAWWERYDTGMEREFGLRYISLRKYFMSYGWKEAGVTELGAEDRGRILSGQTPRTAITDDGTHMTLGASTAVSKLIMSRLFELGILKMKYPLLIP